MPTDTLALIAYVVSTTFTPGPNNITATAAGVALGLKRSLPYLSGIALGFFILMIASGYFTFSLRSQYSAFGDILRCAGFVYMLWLCVSLFVGKKNPELQKRNYSFKNGMLLQLINPKVMLYGITLYGVFAKSLARNTLGILLSAMGLACIGFLAVLTWCSAGFAFNKRLSDKKTLLVFNIAMAALLLYSAFSIILDRKI
jgi:threonine/homoserine/homoserine lactone efflux protein